MTNPRIVLYFLTIDNVTTFDRWEFRVGRVFPTLHFDFLYEGHDDWIIIIEEKMNRLIILTLLILLIAS